MPICGCLMKTGTYIPEELFFPFFSSQQHTANEEIRHKLFQREVGTWWSTDSLVLYRDGTARHQATQEELPCCATPLYILLTLLRYPHATCIDHQQAALRSQHCLLPSQQDVSPLLDCSDHYYLS